MNNSNVNFRILPINRHNNTNLVSSRSSTGVAKKVKIYAILSLVLVSLLFYGVYRLSRFFDKNQLVFQTPLKVALQTPVYTTARITQVTQVITTSISHINILDSDQQYACDKFKQDCSVVVAIMRAESHYRPNAININKDGSADFGCMQINSNTLVGYKIDTSNINVFNCQQNIDIAFKIYSHNHNSFKDWAAYSNGSYKQFLIN